MIGLGPRQRRVLALLAEETAPLRFTEEQCPTGSLASMVRRGLVKHSTRGYRITPKGRKVHDEQ